MSRDVHLNDCTLCMPTRWRGTSHNSPLLHSLLHLQPQPAWAAGSRLQPVDSRVMSQVTGILSAIEQGDRRAAEELLPLVYDELCANWLLRGWLRKSQGRRFKQLRRAW